MVKRNDAAGAAARAAAPAWFDRATAPAALEASTESAWSEFVALRERHEAAFADTAPFVPAAARAGNDATARPVPNTAPGLEAVLAQARAGNRCCPTPARWAELHAQLALLARARGVAPPVAPVSPQAWAMASGMYKRMVLRDQIEWAARHGALPLVARFLDGLRPQDWIHLG